MTTLNSSYQYIGRSNGVSCRSGQWNYYILLYAKTVGDITTGKHSVSIRMRLACEVDSSFYGWATTAYAKAGGVTAFSWSKQQIPNSTWNSSALTEDGHRYPRWIDLKEGTAVVDTGFGTAKEITIEGSWVMNDSYSKDWFPTTGKYATASIKVTLPMLASASTITSAGSVTLGNACSVTWTPQSPYFFYKLRFSIGNWTDTSGIIHPNRTSAYTYTGYYIPMEAASQIPTRSGTMTVTLYTYSDSGGTSQIGTADTETFTVYVPDNANTRPTVSMSLSPVSTLSAPLDSLYIQGKSKVKAELEINTKYGADVTLSDIIVENVAYDSPYESGVLPEYGVRLVKARVKDSREFWGTSDGYITVIPYSKPKVQAASGESNVVAVRCDKDGNQSSSGTYLKVKAKVGYEKVIANGVPNNFGKLQYRYREVGNPSYSSWVTILDTKTSASDEVVTAALLNGALLVTKNYQVQIRAIDNIEEAEPVTLSVASEKVYMHRPAGGNSMALGGYSTGSGIFDVFWKTKARGGLSLFNENGEEISANDILPLPRGPLEDGWNPNDIANGVHEVSVYPLKDPMGNVLMDNGVLIQLAATTDGFVKIQMAFPTDSHTPVYRLKWYTNWSDWTTFKI